MARVVSGDRDHDLDGPAQLKTSLAIILLAAFALAGCGSSPAGGESDVDKPAARRIVALAPHLTELVFAAGAGDRLVGVVAYSDFPEAAKSLPRIGDSFRLDYEAMTQLAPDLVLAWRSGTPADVQNRLRDMGLRVVALDAERLDQIDAQLLEIGRLAGTYTTAESVSAAYREALAALRTRYRDARVVDVFYQVSAQPLFTIGGRHVITEAIETCGGRNIFDDLDGLSPAISLEAVIEAAPDAIIAGHDALEGDGRRELIGQWSDWQSIPAVRNGDLYVVDANRMHRSTTRILEAIAELCGQLDRVRAR